MKIKNIGNSNFILKDKRGNTVNLEPSNVVEVVDEIGRKFTNVYPFIIEVKEPKKVEEEVVVPRETKKKVKRKKNELPNND